MAKTKVRFVEGADVALADFMEFLGDCLLDGVVASDDEASLTITGADTLGTLTGENISLGLASTGTISTWVLEENGETLWTISNAGFDVAALTAAAFAEGYGEDVFAFETYYFDRDWNYRGTDADDLAPPGATTSDGFEIDFVGDDVFTLRGGADALAAGRGDDVVRGGEGRDRLWGEEGADKLFGQAGDDRLWGGKGRDILIGGAGDDRLTGGGGADIFRFKGRFGDDVITDLRGRDAIDLSKARGVSSFEDVLDAASDAGRDVVLDLRQGTITLKGLQVEDLDADMFLV